MTHFVIMAEQLLMFGQSGNGTYNDAYKRILAGFMDGYRLTHEDYDQLAKMGKKGPLILNQILSEYRWKIKYASR